MASEFICLSKLCQFCQEGKVRLFFRIWGNRGDDHDVVSKRVGRFFGRLTVAAGVIPSVPHSPPFCPLLSPSRPDPIRHPMHEKRGEGGVRQEGERRRMDCVPRSMPCGPATFESRVHFRDTDLLIYPAQPKFSENAPVKTPKT